MNRQRSKLTLAASVMCVTGLLLSACGGSNGGAASEGATSSNAAITVNGCEPAKPLIPSDTVETCDAIPGGKLRLGLD